MPGLTDAVIGDVGDLDALVKAAEGADALVHLATRNYSPPESPGAWEVVLRNNIIGTYNAFEAARLQGVKRFVFAGTSQVVDGYPRDQRITWDVLPRPRTRYSVSKVFGEMLGYMYSHEFGMEVVCIRIGSFSPRWRIESREHLLGKYISPRDIVSLFDCALSRPGIRFEIVFGTSNNSRCRFDLDHAREVLGYEPLDAEEDAVVPEVG
jgi:uronate dehydrogenase